MRQVGAVALDLLREAASRRWFLALGLGITAVLAILAFSLRLEVVDGALSATRLFGEVLSTDVRSADVALRPLFEVSAWLIFYGGLCFGILACSDFAPSLLAPGRIELLLSLPIKRWELLAGTFVGVLVLALIGALYGAGGIVAILGFKTGVWTLRPLLAAALAALAFSALYGAMLAAATFVRSAALCAATGAFVFVLGIAAGYRDSIALAFEPGATRTIFLWATAPLPRISTLASVSASVAGHAPVEVGALLSLLAGVAVFSLSMLALSIFRFEGRDY